MDVPGIDAAAAVGGSPSGAGWGWRESVAAPREASERLLQLVGEFFAKQGWTLVLLLLVWYNCKDGVRKRYREWQNKRSLADANRPDRRAVLDRERARAVAHRQAAAMERARAVAAEKQEKKMQELEDTTARFKED